MLDLECPGATFRRQRYLDAGSPVVDLRRLMYAGADSVRWVLERTIRRFPPEVGYLAVEAIDWIEVGREASAWAHYAPTPRALPGDIPHRITICGLFPDEVLPGMIAHEVSHRWRKPATDKVPEPQPLASVDMLAVKVYGKLRVRPLTEAELFYERALYVSRRVAEEMRADQQAREWGFDWPGHDYDERRRYLTAQWNEAHRLALRTLEYDDEDQLAAAAQRMGAA